MANGQRFDKEKLTAAYSYLPLGSIIRVLNLENGKSVTVTVTDRGPNYRLNRILDLSEAAAKELGYIDKGLTYVWIFPVLSLQPEHADIQPILIQAVEDAHVNVIASPVEPLENAQMFVDQSLN